jgi:parallel beta-helix repeat protein
MNFYVPSKHPQKHPQKQLRVISLPLLAAAALIAAIATPAFASLSCVNPGGKAGCFSTIGAAVAAASPGGAIRVAPGTYKEAVVIDKALTLLGADPRNTIIDATDLPNAIYVDGLDNPGLSNVVVTGFTLENSNYEGLLITNASNVIVKNNHVLNNDTLLDIVDATCPGQPSFETGEDFDCGEGVHLSGVAYSTVAGNIIENNSGGILISDDTGETHDNLILGNTVKDNPFDCGITLASHGPFGEAPGAPHLGIVHNTISGNQSIHNGFEVPGAGAGVGIFSDGSGIGLVHGNTVINNELLDNGIPGVAFHSHVGPNFHAPADDLNDNQILSNHISGNGADVGDTPTPGPTGININSGFGGTPITGTVIWGNRIDNEAADVVVNTPANVDLHFNNLLGGGIGVDNLDGGAVNATNNYWGCFGGPGARGCSTTSGPVAFVPFLRIPFL